MIPNHENAGSNPAESTLCAKGIVTNNTLWYHGGAFAFVCEPEPALSSSVVWESCKAQDGIKTFSVEDLRLKALLRSYDKKVNVFHLSMLAFGVAYLVFFIIYQLRKRKSSSSNG